MRAAHRAVSVVLARHGRTVPDRRDVHCLSTRHLRHAPRHSCTCGTGRFNLTLGAIATAVGIGAALSQVFAGSIVHHVGFRAGFLFLAEVALAAFAILFLFMPETRNIRLEDA